MKNIGFAKIIFFTIVVAFLFFIKVFTANEIKNITREKKILSDSLNAVNGKIKSLTFTEYQHYTSRERVVQFATDSLNLERAERPYKKLYIDKNYLEQITRLINKKYE